MSDTNTASQSKRAGGVTKAPKEKKLTGTCAQCGREGLRVLNNGTLPSHKARGQYGRCAGFMPVEGSVVLR